MTLQQAHDFVAESRRLDALIREAGPAALDRVTRFKGWSVEEIVRHLHVWNRGADLSITDEAALLDHVARAGPALMAGQTRTFERDVAPETGRALLNVWRDHFEDMLPRWEVLDPKRRVKWAGPDMSVRSSMTARQMETWSHGQAIYDALGAVRKDTDAIRNIAILGVNTFAWTFTVRGWPVPGQMPQVRLKAPSGVDWTFGEPGAGQVSGDATAFCQVVTQTRNVADTDIGMDGEVARTWMENAQCFAGPPHDPPAAGTRFREA
ncbi:MAG: TIGR03084 family metal-binding protein [Pseudomonadota bacterium]